MKIGGKNNFLTTKIRKKKRWKGGQDELNICTEWKLINVAEKINWSVSFSKIEFDKYMIS